MAENETRLRRNLRKNIPPEGDDYNDAFQNAILRVHAAIKKGIKVRNFETYFFTASLREYRRIVSPYEPTGRGPEDDEEDSELKERGDGRAEMRLTRLKAFLQTEYGEEPAALFLDYMRHKAEDERCNYHSYSAAHGLSRRRVADTVSRIMRYLRRNKDLLKQWDG